MRPIKTAAASLAAILVLVVVGCGGGNKFVGKWNLTGIPGMPPEATATLQFAADNKLSMNFETKNPAGAGEMKLAVTGSYAVKGDDLTFSMTDAKQTLAGLPPEVIKQADASFEKQKPSVLENFNKKGGKVKWEGSDKFTITNSDATVTLVRVK